LIKCVGYIIDIGLDGGK